MKKVNLRGYLYRKLVNKQPKQPPTRAALLLTALKKNTLGAEFPTFTIAPNTGFIALPRTATSEVKSVTYPLIKPYSYANIRFDEKENILVYNVMEPSLNPFETDVLKKIKEGLVQIIDISLSDIQNPDKVFEFLEGNIRRLINEYNFKLTQKEYLKVMYYVYRDFVGLNRIESLMNDPYVEDIGCDGKGVPVYVVHQRFGSLKTNVIYENEEELREFVIKLAERADRYISYAEPLLDGTLRDGARVQASLASDVTTKGPTFSIRKFKEVPFTPTDVMRLNTASSDMLAYLWFVVENGSNILITGGVSTGKTSLLNTISLFIPDESKIVSIEDTRELNLPHENWIPGVSRMGFAGSGVGEITMFELLRESFRQNPDYLIVGEIRGKEAYVMFQGMSSGHPSISTMHAGSVDDVLKRLQTKPISLAAGLLDSLDLVMVMVHAREKGKSARRIKEIVEIESIDASSGTAHVNKPFVWLPAEDIFEYKGNSWLLSKISSVKGIPMNKVVADIAKRKKLLNWMYENNITNMREVVKYINMYRRDREEIDKLLKIRKESE